MDAYDLQKQLADAWRELAFKNDAGSMKKNFPDVLVYVDGKIVTGLIILDGKIILQTE